MIPIFCCPTCRHAWQILGMVEERESIAALLADAGADHAGCITPLCQGRLVRVDGVPTGFHIHELPIRSFYRAIHGFGTGEGDPALASEFARLLKTKKIVDMQITAVGQPERVLVHQFVLEDGTRMHFDSSSRGACCYYIERPGKSCLEVVEDGPNNDEAPVPVSEQDREEVGRGPEAGANEPRSEQSPIPSDAGAQSAGAEPVQSVREGAGVSEDQHRLRPGLQHPR